MLLFLSEKIQICWIYNNSVFANLENYKVSWNFYLQFIIDFYSWIPGSFDTVIPLAGDFVAEGQQLVWGHVE